MTTTGPFVRSVDVPGLGQTTRTWYRQKPITAKPLPYTLAGLYNRGRTGYPDTADHIAWSTVTFSSDTADLRDVIYHKAYNRFVAAIRADSAQLGADFAERKQAYSSVLAHVASLTKAARAFRSGNIPQGLKALGVKKRTVRKSASDMGGVWLEYSYGWKPLVEDIHTAVQAMRRPLPHLVAKGKAQGKKHTYAFEPHYPWYTTSTTYDWHFRCLIQAEVSVANEALWTANQLGIINPMAVAWEVVPFSFVVDWFLPIGNYLQSLTDFVGLNLENSFVTWYGVLDRILTMNAIRADYEPYAYTRKARRVDLTRVLSLPSPPSLSSRFTGFYSARGANAIALLTSTLRDLPTIRKPGRNSSGRGMYNWDSNLF